jgi:hypothetical protein
VIRARKNISDQNVSHVCLLLDTKSFGSWGTAVSQKKKKKKKKKKNRLKTLSVSLCVVGEKSNALSRSCASFSSSDDDDEFWVVWQFL